MRKIEGTVMGNEPFWKSIPDDCRKAISELKRLKVFEMIWDDPYETFADVWDAVDHEWTLWDEGEFPASDGGMTKKEADAAMSWMERWQELKEKYETED